MGGGEFYSTREREREEEASELEREREEREKVSQRQSLVAGKISIVIRNKKNLISNRKGWKNKNSR